MIEVRVAELATAPMGAVVRPVATDFSPVTPAMRRFDEAAGPTVAEQCGRLGDLPLGSAVITAGGELAAEFIVHVAIRSATENPTPGSVRQGLRNALRRLADWEVESVALAPLGTGAGNLDAEESAAAMIPLLVEHVRDVGGRLRATVLVEDEYQLAAFEAAVARLEGSASGSPRSESTGSGSTGSGSADPPGGRAGTES